MTGYGLDNPTITSALEEELMEWGRFATTRNALQPFHRTQSETSHMEWGVVTDRNDPCLPSYHTFGGNQRTNNTGKRPEATHRNPQLHLVRRN